MNALIDFALSHSRMVLTALVLLIVSGIVAYIGLPKESDPNINIPVMYVQMVLKGISPEDSERLLLRPMEQELRTIEGVKEMRAIGYQGGGSVVLEFDAGFDAAKALDDVRAKVDIAKADLPTEAEEPSVHEVNLSLFPVLVVTLSGEVPERTLLRLARDLRDKIEGIGSVLEAKISGNREELVELVIDPLRLESYGLNADDIGQLVGRSNRLVTAGTLDTGRGRFAINVPGLFENADDILNMPLKVNGDAVVRIRDVATLRQTFKDAESYARINGHPAVGLEVSKRTGENIIGTIAQVRQVVEAERANWPAQIRVTYSQDRSADIQEMLKELQNSLIFAIVLVMIIIIGALGLRGGTMVGIAIPASFLIGILVLALAGLTINVVVLFSLILAAGMLVDGAIVLVEYADRKMIEGMPKLEAYRAAAKAMAWPITSSLSVTIVVFLPLIFWPGVVGEFMKYLPITLTATLIASLVVAMVFTPVLGATFGKARRDGDHDQMIALEQGDIGALRRMRGMTGSYVRVVDWALDRPLTVLFAAAVMLIAMWFVYISYGRGFEFFPDIEPESALLQIHGRGNMSIDEKDKLIREVEAQILDMQRERPEFKTIYSVTLAATGNTSGQDLAEDAIGTIQLEFADWQERRKAADIIEEIRTRTAKLAGITVEPRSQEAGPNSGRPIDVQLTSRFPELLAPAVEKVRGAMGQIPGLVDIEDTRPIPGIEWQIDVDRAQAARYGVDVTALGNTIQLITLGLKFGSYRPDYADDEIDIVARFPDASRNITELDRLRVQTRTGLVPISNFVTRSGKPKVSTINRIDGERALNVRADVAPGVLADDKIRDVKAWLAGTELDPRINVTFKGQDEEQQQAQAFLGKAFVMAMFLMAIILLTQFNSFYSSAVILAAVIMSTVGVLIGLLITGQPFGIVMSGIGVIALAGIVVNHNIILVGTSDRLRHSAASQREAILRTCAQRLRPVLLTTVTAILGLLPMVFRVNIDFITREVTVGAPSTQWWTQLSTGIVFGLAFATVLTLIVTPAALMVRADFQSWRQRRHAAEPVTSPAIVAQPAKAAE
ncbi:MAG TPA: efflux RND transporter permease subunit [Dongiaceae bacterium]|nr:efflux RND transporter permease subunit [Dongiaceae bacterium]